MDECIQNIMNVLTTVSILKTRYFYGDLNIDSLNFENHKNTKDFIESLFGIDQYVTPNTSNKQYYRIFSLK